MPFTGQTAMDSPPPPPPPPSDDSAFPTSFHLNAQKGGGANLPASSEVVVAKLRASAASPSSKAAAHPPLADVDVSGIPAEQQAITAALRASFERATGVRSDKLHKKKMEDVSKKLGQLVGQLSAGEIEPAVVEQLMVVASLLEGDDFEAAKRLAADFSKTVSWEDHRHWIQALSRLIDVLLVSSK